METTSCAQRVEHLASRQSESRIGGEYGRGTCLSRTAQPQDKHTGRDSRDGDGTDERAGTHADKLHGDRSQRFTLRPRRRELHRCFATGIRGRRAAGFQRQGTGQHPPVGRIHVERHIRGFARRDAQQQLHVHVQRQVHEHPKRHAREFRLRQSPSEIHRYGHSQRYRTIGLLAFVAVREFRRRSGKLRSGRTSSRLHSASRHLGFDAGATRPRSLGCRKHGGERRRGFDSFRRHGYSRGRAEVAGFLHRQSRRTCRLGFGEHSRQERESLRMDGFQPQRKIRGERSGERCGDEVGKGATTRSPDCATE